MTSSAAGQARTRSGSRRRRRAYVAGLAGGVALATAATALPAQALSGAGALTLSSTTFGCRATQVFNSMTTAERLGQMFMVGTPATAASTTVLDQISAYHIGNVMLTGRSSSGTAATARVSAALQARASAAGLPKLFVSTDQEGGYVQVLSGPGFSTMPTALTQGTWATDTLYYSARAWANQLKSAGVNMNLGPVMDTVPGAAYAKTNPPIGVYHREYGYTSSTVLTKGNAFTQGMRSAGMAVTAKHFPGLGYVHANTDTTANVHDTSTTTTHPYLRPFQRVVTGHTNVVMMSSAYYDLIDKAHPAVFSSYIVNTMLRSRMGFWGIVMSDDTGNAKAMTVYTPQQRAYNFLVGASGDMLLTVNPAVIPSMVSSMLTQAQSSAAVRARINYSAKRILLQKEQQGLLGPAC